MRPRPAARGAAGDHVEAGPGERDRSGQARKSRAGDEHVADALGIGGRASGRVALTMTWAGAWAEPQDGAAPPGETATLDFLRRRRRGQAGLPRRSALRAAEPEWGMGGMSSARQPVRAARAAGFSVHLFTASGGAVAVLALYAAIERRFDVCFAWLGLALFIDGIDGTLARAAKVRETAEPIDGVVLDLVVDFLTYVRCRSWRCGART